MADKKYSRKLSNDKQQEIKELSEMALQQIESYSKSPENVLEYADYISKFHNYSPRNARLIQNQFSGALAVASFKDWKDKGYSVNKGEKGIKILSYTPFKMFKDKNGEKKQFKFATKEEKDKIKKGEIKTWSVNGFKIGHVFDVSQTNAPVEDLPKIFPNRQYNFNVSDTKDIEYLKKGIDAVAKDLGIEIKDMKDSKFGMNELGSAKGAFVEGLDGTSEILLNSRNTSTQAIATSIHELSHARIHSSKNNSTFDTPTKEFQAELTSYIVCKRYGMDTSEKAIPYIAGWTKNGAAIEDREKALEEVHRVSNEFIEVMDDAIGKEKSLDISRESYMYPSEEKALYCHMSGNGIGQGEKYFEVDYGTGPVTISKEAKELIYTDREWEQLGPTVKSKECNYEELSPLIQTECPKKIDDNEYYFYNGRQEPLKLGSTNDIYDSFKNGENENILTKVNMQDLAIIKNDDKESANLFLGHFNHIYKNPTLKDFQEINMKNGIDKNVNLASFKENSGSKDRGKLVALNHFKAMER